MAKKSGTGVMSVGAKVSRKGVSGTSKVPRIIKPYPSGTSRGPRG